MASQPVSIEQRDHDVTACERLVLAAAEHWFDAHVAGTMTPEREAELSDALHAYRASIRRRERTEKRLAHSPADCEAILESDPAFDRFRCQPAVFTCVCGVTWLHVCDEAEGCCWVREQMEAAA